MFNHSMGKPRASQYNDDQYAFSHQAAWHSANISPSATRPPHQIPQPSGRSSFMAASDTGGAGGMDWAPSPSVQTHFHQQNYPVAAQQQDHDFQFETLDQQQQQANHGGGVGRLVAHFENNANTKSFAPPLPPRPADNISHHNVAASPPNSMSNSMSYDGYLHSSSIDRVASPLESQFGSFDVHQSRGASPLASSPPHINFGSFHDPSRGVSPVATSSSAHFGSLDDFMSNTQVHSPMVTSPMGPSPFVPAPSQSNSAVPGTPGFEIWRPPGAAATKSPQSQPQYQNSDSHSTNQPTFFKPPVPTTPKPSMTGGNQFILELNPSSKAKGKAVVKPPKPRVPPPVPTSAKPMTSLKIETDNVLIPDLLSDTPTASQHGDLPAPLRPSASRPSREQVPAEAWEQFKTTIRSLYLEERKPLKEVMSIMADKYGFQAT
jgi:hypothetical protein